MAICAKCHREIGFGERICYNDEYMCPHCVYESSPPDSAVRIQMERNYSDFLGDTVIKKLTAVNSERKKNN